jgi:hypothetical protein
MAGYQDPHTHPNFAQGHGNMMAGYYFEPDPDAWFDRRSMQRGLPNWRTNSQPAGYYPGCSLIDPNGGWGYVPGMQPWPYQTDYLYHMPQLQRNQAAVRGMNWPAEGITWQW